MRTIALASDFVIADGVTIKTCSAEDVIVLRAFAARDRDWLDIEGVALRQAGKLDLRLISSEIEPLLELKGTPEDSGRLRRILGSAE